MQTKHFLLLPIAMTMMTVTACNGKTDQPSPDPNQGGGKGDGEVIEVKDVTPVTSNLTVNLSTDKAAYAPGTPVKVAADALVADARVRYRHGISVIKEEPMSAATWSWTPPNQDYTGYMIDIYRPEASGAEQVLGTIAVDVSSDWKRFPRYGFVATFDRSKLKEGVIEKEMEWLNRCHINGVQFQDWHCKHHWPLGGTRENPAEFYTDIANREISREAVRRYIEVQHQRGMKSIFYNLCFGALSDAKEDGVKEEWYLFKNANRSSKDWHDLPSSWKSNIFLLDPSNTEWQRYIGDRNDDVYAVLPFDGYQIDQLGSRGTRYTYDGKRINMAAAYASFIHAMKERHPDKRLIMNAVASFGGQEIAATGKVDFCYNEVWSDEAKFTDLHRIIRNNYINGKLPTVFAAYMNYDLAGRTSGLFNTPGVILTDAVMMALGGSHLELGGDHMLSREYFPTAPLLMPHDLRTAMIRYYDFMTAYENLLRGTDTSTEFSPSVGSTDVRNPVAFNVWPPKEKSVTVYARKVDGKSVLHFLNFLNIDNLSWRDANATRPAPSTTSEMPVAIRGIKGKITKIWAASPDLHGGAPFCLPFKQKDEVITITLPPLKYWNMLVIE